MFNLYTKSFKMSLTSLHSNLDASDNGMQQARSSWSETVDEMQVSTSPTPSPALSKSQTDFTSLKISKFSKIDDSSHFLNSSASEAAIQNEFAAVSSPITAIKDFSNAPITATTSQSLGSMSTSSKKRKVRDSPTLTRSTDTFVSVESSIFDQIHRFQSGAGERTF